MKPRGDAAPTDSNAFAPTIDLTPSRSLGDPGEPVVPIVQGSGPHLSSETRSLLQARLRAAVLVLLLAAILFMVRSILLFFTTTRTLPREIYLVTVLHVTLLAGFVAEYMLLSGRRALTLRRLRALELTTVASVVAFLAARQYSFMLLSVRAGDVTQLVSTIRGSIIYCLLMTFGYCMLIPNTWRRAAAVVLTACLVPLCVDLVLAHMHPELIRFAKRVATPEQVSENFLIATVGMLMAIYGTHIINTLRVEAFAMRQLNQYQLRRRLGAGGMGEVYLAEHRLLKRPCALKLIRPGRAADARALARFEREVRSAAKLSHPNTIEIYDYGHSEDGTFYYVMEYLPGLSLAELVDRHGPLPPGRVIYLLRPACEALGEAHAAGLIHRDLKPANIFAARRGGRYDVAKLLDFGLVKPTADPESPDLSQDGAIAGSPLFMSPEQASGESRPDARSDLYALGAVAYFLLTGRPPFQGKSPMAVMIAHARDPAIPPSRLRTDVPDDLERVVLRCLAKDPADRYPDAESLGRALAECRSADEWDSHRAAQWWRAFEPTPAEEEPLPV
jgi:serine/threonine-protein kinase